MNDFEHRIRKDITLRRENIFLTKLLGNGNFGDVYKGHYSNGIGTYTNVAIKTYREEGNDAETATSFLEEAYRMVKFQHDHIIKLIGICPEYPVWIVMELAKYGELTSYLKTNKCHLGLNVLLLYAYQISTAMSYLEAIKFVHRDIAARNVLVFEHDCVKLGDFGLSRFVGNENLYFKVTVGKLPIKWMSPESINYRVYTSASDVWMFGVYMWELMTLGDKPFSGMKNDDVIYQIEEGLRLSCPLLCPDDLYQLMCQCWSYKPEKRPTFNRVEKVLKKLLNGINSKTNIITLRHSGSGYKEENDLAPPKPPRHSDYSFCSTTNQHVSASSYKEKTYSYSVCGNLNNESPETLDKIIEQQKIQCEEDAEWLRQTESSFFSTQ